jgi:hypothetical protein
MNRPKRYPLYLDMVQIPGSEWQSVMFKAFEFQGQYVQPASAYTTYEAYRSHLGDVAKKLGRLYIMLLFEIEADYFRYVLLKLRDELIPSAKVAIILIELQKLQNKRTDADQ